MASITATPLDALGVVKVLVDWRPTYQGDLMSVYRRVNGVQTEVIGSPIYLSAGQAILYDTAAPFGVPVEYRAVISDPLTLSDSFNRTSVVAGWGTPVFGPGPYVVRTGTAANFNTFGSTTLAQITNTATNVPQVISMPTTLRDVEVGTTVRAPGGVTGQPALSSIYTRYTDSLNFYQFAIAWMPDGTVQARIYRRQTSPSTLVLITSQTVGTYAPGQDFRMRVRVIGSRLELRVWSENLASTVVTVNDTVQTGAGYVGWGATLTTGYTGTLPLNQVFDSVEVFELVEVALTSAPTTLVSGRDGWIRDPQQPARSVRLDNCESHTLDCLDAERFVFFQGTDAEGYDSATGVFEVVGAQNPLTVAQTRKGKETSLRVVSTTLGDIPALKSLFSSGRDLLVSLPLEYGWGTETYGTEPVTVGQVNVSRLNRRDMRKPERLWTLPVRVTDDDQTYPDGWTGSNGIPITGATYADMTATGLTYAQLTTGGKTYLQWSQGVFV